MMCLLFLYLQYSLWKFLPWHMHAFWRWNDDAPPHARIVFSTCTLFFHSNPYMSALWMRQVKMRSMTDPRAAWVPWNSPALRQTEPTHPFSHHTPSHPPSLFKLTPYPRSPVKTCGGNPLLAILAWYATKGLLYFWIFQLLITLRTLPHTLYARSMSWPSTSHTSVSKPHFIIT